MINLKEQLANPTADDPWARDYQFTLWDKFEHVGAQLSMARIPLWNSIWRDLVVTYIW